MSYKVLVLNKFYFPVGICDEKRAMCNIFSNVVYPLDVTYETNEFGEKIDQISYFDVIKHPKEWLKLPIRGCDNFIKTISGKVRIPTVVVCSSYDGIPHKNAQFPTKLNILKRDKFVCGYSGLKLSKQDITVDHIFPKSRHLANPNTWENQICCHRELNFWKGDKLLEECDLKFFNPSDDRLKNWKATQGNKLKLIKVPKKPDNGFIFTDFIDDWEIFLKSDF